jgi:hypothetical protein
MVWSGFWKSDGDRWKVDDGVDGGTVYNAAKSILLIVPAEVIPQWEKDVNTIQRSA